MKISLIVCCCLLLWSCSNEQQAQYDWKNLNVEGELLFSGPNTLQGQPDASLFDIAKAIGTEPEKIKKIYITEANIEFQPDSLSTSVESVLFQWVGANLDLVSVATKSPINQGGIISLDVKQDQDILPYIKDATSTMVVDVNLNQDLDYLQGSLALKLTIVY